MPPPDRRRDFLLKVTTTSMGDLEALIEALLPYGNPVTAWCFPRPSSGGATPSPAS